MSTLTPDALADIAEEAARAVGPALVEAFDNPGPVELKADFHDVVTVHDKASEATIRRILFERAPESIMLGEEEGQFINATGEPVTPAADDVVWLVDPIDGTSNFASGVDRWCVSIAAVQGERALAGVIYRPTHEAMYRRDSRGSFKNDEQIHVKPMPLQEAIIPTEFPSSQIRDREGSFAAFFDLVDAAKSVRRHGSTAMDLAEIAEGIFLGTFGIGTQPWDVAAGIALIEGAGGRYVGIFDDRTRTETATWECASYVCGANDLAIDFFNGLVDQVAPQPLSANFFADKQEKK